MKWVRIEFSDESHIDGLPRGRSAYVRAVLDRHLDEVVTALRALYRYTNHKLTRDRDEILELVRAGETAMKDVDQTVLDDVSDFELRCLRNIWWEMEHSRLSAEELLSLLEKELTA